MKPRNFKKQILNIFTESFSKNDKSKMKELLMLLKENSELKDLYLFYEEIERKYIDNKNLAEEYVNLLSEQLKGKNKIFADKMIKNLLNENVEDYDVENSELYSQLDTLLEEDNIRNIDKKIIAKKYLVEYLTTKKEIESEDNEDIEPTLNENLLNTVLTSNFNTYFNNVLNEEEKQTLKDILSLNESELKINFNTLKEEVSSKLESLITESNGELKEKLEMTKNELSSMKMNKYNYYKLMQLKNGI